LVLFKNPATLFGSIRNHDYSLIYVTAAESGVTVTFKRFMRSQYIEKSKVYIVLLEFGVLLALRHHAYFGKKRTRDPDLTPTATFWGMIPIVH
jgi:hypothetical protein